MGRMARSAMDIAEGYVLHLGLDENDEIIGYEYVHLGKMMSAIKKGVEPAQALADATGRYGRYDEAVKTIDPRKE